MRFSSSIGSFAFCPRSSNLRLAEDGLDKSPRFRCLISETVSQPEGAVGIRQAHSSSREGAIREARRRAGGVRVLLWSGFCRGGRHGTEGIPKTASRRDFGSANAGRVFIPRCSKRFVQPTARSQARNGTRRTGEMVCSRAASARRSSRIADRAEGIAGGTARGRISSDLERFDATGNCRCDEDADEYGGIALSLRVGKVAREAQPEARVVRVQNAES